MKSKLITFMFVSHLVFNAHASFIHIDDRSFKMDTQKRSSPAIATKINGMIMYGALYSGTAPGKTVFVQYGNKYWLGQNCAPGTYSHDGIEQCEQCGTGHYCFGLMHRSPCTHGAISCPGDTHASDADAPDNAPINRLMTLDEVNTLIPETNFNQWRQLSCCSEFKGNVSTDLNNVNNACSTGTIGPGTYLFTTRYTHTGYVDSITGTTGIASAFIVVFDHPVSYASIHGVNIYQHFIDTNHATYTEYTFSTAPISSWILNKNETNIQNLAPLEFSLCVYELN